MDYFSYKSIQGDNNSRISRALLTDNCTVFDLNLISNSLPTPPITPSPPFDVTMRKRRFSNPTNLINIPKLHILIVDDNPINLQILSRLLKLHLSEYIQHIELVKSGIKALEVLKCRPFDIILMDIDMPILNGVETTKHIRSSIEFDILPKNRKIPIVAVTTNDSKVWRRLYNQIGMNGCVSKPINTTDLKSTLSAVLGLPNLIFPTTPE